MTLGPFGNHVIIYNEGKELKENQHQHNGSRQDDRQDPHNHHNLEQEALGKLFPKGILVASDGFTVARHIHLSDRAADLGARLIIDLAADMDVDESDGRTTAMLLAWGIIQKAMVQVEAGEAVTAVNRGIKEDTAHALDYLEQQARPVDSVKELKAAAATAAGDTEIGETTAAVVEKIGPYGIVTIREGHGRSLEVEYGAGMELDAGYVSPLMITDIAESKAVLENPHLLIYDRQINKMEQLGPLFLRFARAGKNLLILAEKVSGQALELLVDDKVRSQLQVVAVSYPGTIVGHGRKLWMDDIATLTGAEVISEELGRRIEDIQVAQLGKCERAIVSASKTTLVGGRGDPAAIRERIGHIGARLEEATSDYEREQLQERMAQLGGKAAVIRLGAPTDPELQAQKNLVNSGLAAGRAALREGILPGGESSLMHAARSFASDSILAHALARPLRQIAINAGQDGQVIARQVRDLPTGEGYDARMNRFGNMCALGVVDAASTTRAALRRAASLARTALTTETLVVDLSPRTGLEGVPHALLPGHYLGD